MPRMSRFIGDVSGADGVSVDEGSGVNWEHPEVPPFAIAGQLGRVRRLFESRSPAMRATAGMNADAVAHLKLRSREPGFGPNEPRPYRPGATT